MGYSNNLSKAVSMFRKKVVGMGVVKLFDDILQDVLERRNPQSQHIWTSFNSFYQTHYIALFFLAEDGSDTFEIPK